MRDFSKITACGECCVGCKKKEFGFCKGCIESEGNCKEWEKSGGCPIYKCAMKHNVQFCVLCLTYGCRASRKRAAGRGTKKQTVELNFYRTMKNQSTS